MAVHLFKADFKEYKLLRRLPNYEGISETNDRIN